MDDRLTVDRSTGNISQAPAAAGERSEELISHVRGRPDNDRRYAIDYRKAAREGVYATEQNLATGSENCRIGIRRKKLGAARCWVPIIQA